MPAVSHESTSVAIPKARHVSESDAPERACPMAAAHCRRLALLRHPHPLVTTRPVPATSTKNINRSHHGT